MSLYLYYLLFFQHTHSMTETLAILAIIAALSIIALLQFSYVMNKLRANDTI